MKFTRRNFLAWASLSAVGAVACDIFGEDRVELKIQSPARQPEDLVKGTDNWYATLCHQCPVNHGILVRVMEGRAKKVRGNPLYPVNRGKQSPRCDAGLQALYHPDRLIGPLRRTGPRGSGVYQSIGWPQGLDLLRAELQARGDGLLLATEPVTAHAGMIAGRFAQAFGGQHLGFEPLDRTVYRRAVNNVFGQDLLPDFDIANTNYLLSFSADFLSTWVSPTRWAVAYGEFRQGEGRTQRGTHVHIDPRYSMTAANADKWVPIRPGTEGYLALSIAQVILAEGLQAPGVNVGALTGGQGAAALDAYTPDRVGPMLELPEGMLAGKSPADFIRELGREFAGHRPALAIGGDSAAAHSNGLFNLEAIYALNYLVGSVGETGGVRFNPGSPLPNLPASANVGSLADWTSVADDLRGGRTRLVMLHTADPVYGLPESVGFREALDRDDPFIVSFSPFMDETTVMADLILPDRIYLEDWGSDIPEPGPGYQIVGMQQPVVNPLSDLDPRSSWDILLSMGQELGREADLPWGSLREALRETSDALLALNRGSVQATSPEGFWNNMLRQGGWWDERETGPSASAPDGLLSTIANKGAQLRFSGDGFYLVPFAHNTLLDGRNTHLPWAQAAPDPITTITWQSWVEMNERRMQEMGLREGDIVRVEASQGSITAPVYPNPGMPPQVVGVPLGQGRRNGPEYAIVGDQRESSNVLSILEPGQVEDTGALAWASNRVSITPTSQSIRISKFEGEFPSREIGNQIDNNPGEEVIRTTSPGEHQ
jgi:anaerobic selenocysteine-containing dehydrogenase